MLSRPEAPGQELPAVVGPLLGADFQKQFYSECVSVTTELALVVGRCSSSALHSVSCMTVGESFRLLVSPQNAEGAGV